MLARCFSPGSMAAVSVAVASPPEDRQRCVLPIPDAALDFARDSAGKKGGVCRAVRRRREKGSHIDAVTKDTIQALNGLYDNSGKVLSGGGAHSPTLAQLTAVDQLRDHAAWLGAPPVELSRQGALRELLAKTAYTGCGQGAVVDIDVDAVALPPWGFRPVSIESIAGAEHLGVVDRLLEKVLPARCS